MLCCLPEWSDEMSCVSPAAVTLKLPWLEGKDKQQQELLVLAPAPATAPSPVCLPSELPVSSESSRETPRMPSFLDSLLCNDDLMFSLVFQTANYLQPALPS